MRRTWGHLGVEDNQKSERQLRHEYQGYLDHYGMTHCLSNAKTYEEWLGPDY